MLENDYFFVFLPTAPNRTIVELKRRKLCEKHYKISAPNRTIVELKQWRFIIPEMIMTATQSNHSGIETRDGCTIKGSRVNTQSNHSGIETHNDQ